MATEKTAKEVAQEQIEREALRAAQRVAKRFLRMELHSKGTTYKDLVRLLREIDVVETERSIQGKIARGSFSFAFFLQCMRVHGITKIDLDR